MSTDGTPGGQKTVVSKRQVASGVWTYVEMKLEDGILSLWMNGVLDRSVKVKGPIHAGTAPLWIGAQPGKNAPRRRYYKGLIDEVALGLAEAEEGALAAAE